MSRSFVAGILLACMALLSGCASEEPSATIYLFPTPTAHVPLDVEYSFDAFHVTANGLMIRPIDVHVTSDIMAPAGAQNLVVFLELWNQSDAIIDLPTEYEYFVQYRRQEIRPFRLEYISSLYPDYSYVIYPKAYTKARLMFYVPEIATLEDLRLGLHYRMEGKTVLWRLWRKR